LLRRWHAVGLALNDLAHRFNATGEIEASELARLLGQLRRLGGASFPTEWLQSSSPALRARAGAPLPPAEDLPEPRPDGRPTCVPRFASAGIARACGDAACARG
jgi:hypothetical protein